MQNLTEQKQKHNKLRQVVKTLKEDFGLTASIGIELEFYLNDIKDLSSFEQEIGYQLKSEKGHDQYEIDFPPSLFLLNYLKQVENTRELIKYWAKSQGGQADFSSKPSQNDYGSAMHVHLNFLEDTEIEKYAKILCHYLPASLAIFLPQKADYARLEAKFMAPTHICYGNNNRSVAIRIISYPVRRLEHRLPAAISDPILVVTTILNSIKRGLEAPYLIKNFDKIYGNASDEQYNLVKITPGKIISG